MDCIKDDVFNDNSIYWEEDEGIDLIQHLNTKNTIDNLKASMKLNYCEGFYIVTFI